MVKKDLMSNFESLKNLSVNGIQILQKGKELGGFMEDMGGRQNQYSITKSITSAAVGIAISDGLLSLDDPVCVLLEEMRVSDKSYWRNVKVRHLLTMTMGLEKPLLLGDSRKRLKEKDWVSYILGQKVVHKPGTRFQYSNAGPYLLGVLLQRLSGMDLADYLQVHLFDALGIERPQIERCPGGYMFVAGGLHLNVKELGRFGQLYLQKGVWNGKQLLSRDWVTQSTARQIDCGERNGWVDGYGYLFWHLKGNMFMASGKYGQYCIVIPDREAVISVNSDNRQEEMKILEYLIDTVIQTL